jgi:hypothetical protein
MLSSQENKIIVHCLVRNEENFIWYALNSVLPYVDKIMVWDTGSQDKTIEIIKSIRSPKIEFKEVGLITADQHPEIRNMMLKSTDKNKYRWLMILDGDEVWHSTAIKKVIDHLESHPNTQAVFMRTLNCVEDIYHKRPKPAGHYSIKGITGHLNLRFMNLKTIPGLHAKHPHGQEGYYSEENILVQELPKVDFVDTAYLHATRLQRSSLDKVTLKRKNKIKYELGDKTPENLIPEIIFKDHPSIVPDVSKHMGIVTFIKCVVQTLPRRIKRMLVTPEEGY